MGGLRGKLLRSILTETTWIFIMRTQHLSSNIDISNFDVIDEQFYRYMTIYAI